MPRHCAQRCQRVGIKFAHAFGNQIDLIADFQRLFIEQQMQVAETRAFDMPMEMLGLDEKREVISQQPVKLGNQGGF